MINRWFARLTECGKAKSHIVNVGGTGLSDILCAVDKGVARGGPGVPVTPPCKPLLRKQPTIFRGENAMTIMFDTV